MKYLLVALVAVGLMGGMASANERITGIVGHDCNPRCPSQGPQGTGAQKGDHHYPTPLGESSNSESHKHDTSTEKRWPPVVY